MALHAQGKTTRQIAEAVYGKDCDVSVKMAYVRTVVFQRKGGSRSPHDDAWLLRKFGGKTVAEAYRNRWKQDPTYRERHARNVLAYIERKASGAGPATQVG